jgi:ABC-type nitrate/sulfonate/bicarbonate transport system substrate-binding protein
MTGLHGKLAMGSTMDRRQALGAGCGMASLLVAGCQKQASSSRADIVMTQGVSGLVVHEVAKEQGFFKNFNLEPNVLVVSDGIKCVAALLSGAAKICMWSGFNQLAPAIERGGKMKILAGALSLSSLAMYSANPNVRKVSDLEGKVLGIGAAGSVLHQMTVLLLKKKGVNVDTVRFLNVGSNADILKAIIAKTVDAGLSDVDVFDQQQSLGIHALTDGLLWQEIPQYTNQGTYASDAAIAADRDMLVRVLAAYAKAYRYVSAPESRDAFVQAREKVTGKKDEKASLTQWTWIQKNQPYAKDLVLTDEQINFVQRVNVDFKVQKAVLPIAQIADMSLARDALKLLTS